MKLLIILIVIAGLVLMLRLSIAWFGPAKPVNSGIDRDNGGLLHPCPQSPNCFSTQLSVTSGDAKSADSSSATTAIIESLQHTVVNAGGHIEQQNDNYLHATFKSRVLGFVDDFECLVVSGAAVEKPLEDAPDTTGEELVLHCRGASRIGHSDLGVNKKRVTALLESASFKPPG